METWLSWFTNELSFSPIMLTSPQVSLQPSKSLQNIHSTSSLRGILTAFTIIGTWAISLFFLLRIDISELQILMILLAVFWQTFLYTGLFITAHDAMHGVVFPKNIKINNLVGRVTLLLYALFPYDNLLKKHWSHHRNPASHLDPDFHDGKHKNFFAWYIRFLQEYESWQQIVGLMLIFNFISYALHISQINLTIFWAIPAIISSLQLFYFGTFLPHREPKAGYKNIHCAQTSNLPAFWSFITCYHFGYHEEHHEYPHVPWWGLPTIYRMKQDE
jgi:beta-carotene ketolase (CrtW type)